MSKLITNYASRCNKLGTETAFTVLARANNFLLSSITALECCNGLL